MRKAILPVSVVLTAALAGALLVGAVAATVAAASPSFQPSLTSVEPDTMVSQAGGTLSIYGSDLTTSTLARLVGFGLLDTTYVNSTALQAEVPPGVPPGTYDLEVSDAGGSDTLPSALTIVGATPTPAPTAVPAPQPTPVPGRPNLTILNYSTEPARVVVGREFVVTLEIYNNGSRAGENTMVTFHGGAFVPVGETGHLLWQLHINNTAVVTQRMRVPSGLGSGTYNLRVDISANDWEGNHYEYPETIAVEVIGVGYGRPQLVIEAAQTDPAVLRPGDAFSLTLRLSNVGDRTATDVVLRAASTDLVAPAGGSNAVAVEPIGVNRTVTVTLPLVVGDVAQGGRLSLEMELGYGDYGGRSYSDRQTIGLEVSTGLADRPQLLIAGYRTSPDPMAPGDAFTLTLEVNNVGGGAAQRLILTLGGEGAGGLGPFSPLSSSNVRFVPYLDAGETVKVLQRLAVDGSADPGAYSLPVALAYDDDRGTRHTDSQVVGLEVSTGLENRPQLVIAGYRSAPDPVAPGDVFALTLEVSNVGGGEAQRLMLTLGGEATAGEGGGLGPFGPLASSNVLFVPHLDPGETAEVVQQLVVDGSADAGSYSLPVVLEYDDNWGARHTDSQRISLLVRRRPHLQIGFYRPMEPAPVDVPFELPVEVTNIGRTLVNVSRLEVSSVQLEISDGSLYLGPLDGGTSGSLEATAVAQDGGTAEVLVTIHYLDDFEQPQVVTDTLSVEVEQPSEAPPEAVQEPEGEETIWDKVLRFLRGLLGLGS